MSNERLGLIKELKALEDDIRDMRQKLEIMERSETIRDYRKEYQHILKENK